MEVLQTDSYDRLSAQNIEHIFRQTKKKTDKTIPNIERHERERRERDRERKREIEKE